MKSIANKTKYILGSKKGLVLILVAAGIALMLIMSGVMARLGLQARMLAIRTSQELLARAAADAGHDRAVYEMNKMTSNWPASNDPFPTPQSGTLPGTNQSYEFIVTRIETSPMGLESYDPYIFNIESTGWSGTTSPVERKVYSTVYLRCPNQFGIFMQDTLEIKNGGGVDAYNSMDGAYGAATLGGTNSNLGVDIGTNASGDSDVTLRLDVDIALDSEIHVGPLDQMGAAERACDVVGGQGADDFPDGCIVAEPVIRPINKWLLPEDPSGAGTLTVQNGQTECLDCNGNTAYQGIRAHNGATITVQGPDEVILTVGAGGIILDQGSTLEIEAGATLTLYLGGDFEAKQSSIVMNGGDAPANLTIRGTEACQNVIIHNDGDFNGVVDAPYAFLDIKNSGDFYGSVYGYNAVIRNSGAFHYDYALQETFMGDLGAYFHVAKWNEWKPPE